MARPLRYLPETRNTVEVTTRAIQRRLLLRPSNELNEIVVGILGMALELCTGIELHAVAVLSNHVHMILTTPDAALLARFMCFVNGNLAKEAGRLHRWREKFWARRYRSIPILDDTAQLARMRYLLSHGCKENLVARPADWPGVHSANALAHGETLVGCWFDRSAEYAARRRGEEFDRYEYAERQEVTLSPLPCLQARTEAQRQAFFRGMLEEIEAETRERMEREGIRPMGAARILRQDPHDAPAEPKRSPAPWCHAATRATRKLYYEAYRVFFSLYREAADRLRAGDRLVEFPPGCFPPALPFPGSETPAAACGPAP